MADSTKVNLKVAVRCRPMSAREISTDASLNIVFVEDNSVNVKALDEEDTRHFKFEQCFGPETTEEEIYDAIGRPIVTQALDGINGTLIAYGQTGAGKSHSLMGSVENEGVIFRLCVDLFNRVSEKLNCFTINNDSSTTAIFEIIVTASYLEIYKEEIQDLLVPEGSNLKLKEAWETGVYVQGLSSQVPNTLICNAQILALHCARFVIDSFHCCRIETFN